MAMDLDVRVAASLIDLTGGFAPAEDLMSPDVPADDPHYRESVSMWIFDDANRIQLPRFLVEDIAGRRDERLTFFNLAFPGGRSLVEWGQAPARPMAGADGRPTVYGAGGMAFHCIEPFHRWRAEYSGEMFDTRAADLMFAAPAGPRVPVQVEIETRSVVPLWVHGRMSTAGAQMMAEDSEARRFTGNGFRYEQLVQAEGWVKIGDETRIDFSGRGLRVHRRSSRISAGFRGHVWQSAVFPSGKGFGYTIFPPLPDGAPTFGEGYFFDGRQMIPAEPVDVPWMRVATPNAQDVGFTLRTANGDVRIDAVTGPTNFSTVRSAADGDADPLLQQQGSALYSLGGESAYGMIERSSYRSQLTLER